MTAERPLPTEDAAEEERQFALYRAINGLRDDYPLLSASKAVVGWQRVAIWSVLVIVVTMLVSKPSGTLVVIIGACTFGYVLTMTDRVLIFRKGLAARPIAVSDERARAIPDDDLPRYTILVPAYDEPQVVGDLIDAMSSLEYPPDRLQVLLLLEADDAVTIAAAEACGRSDTITIVLVPPADPRTKPKACNFGLHFATGDIVTIFDAEDLPEPLQLRRVAWAMSLPRYAPQEYALAAVLAPEPDSVSARASQERRIAATFSSERHIAAYLDDLDLPEGSVITDTVYGFAVVMASKKPRTFVVPSDLDFVRLLNDPVAFGVRYLLAVPPTGRGMADALNVRYPTLYETGANIATLALEAPNNGDGQPNWRIYQVNAPPSIG